MRMALVLCLVSGAAFLHAQNAPNANALAVTPAGCTGAGQELRQPLEIRADPASRVLRTELDIRQFDATNVLTYHSTGCTTLPAFQIRNYGWRPAPGEPFVYGYPGPTLRLRKGLTRAHGGDALQILLTNNLPNLGEDACNKLCNTDCTSSGTDANCGQCVSDTNPQAPNCFHGENTTNLHFHGLHVSPQSPQDYVLLELQPFGSSASAHASHGANGGVAVGSFPYSVNPIPWNQPEGTHWYHPHKHGSTALQLGNGMAGALIVEGPFDDWLNAQFPQPPREKVLVLQQIHDLNFYALSTTALQVIAPIPMINGQIAPKITMYPGEIQRWRFVAATIDATAQLEIDFNGPSNQGAAVKQIAMDGVQFAPENYAAQPLIPSPQDGQFKISPGNRADFLVQAPSTPGRYSLTYEVFGNVGGQGTRRLQRGDRNKPAPTRQNILAVHEALAPGDAETVLLSIEVAPCNDASACPSMDFPGALPPLPWYLRDIGDVDEDDQHKLQFFVDQIAAQPQKIGIAVDDDTDPQKFQPDCAVFTNPLGNTGQWTLSQNLDPPDIAGNPNPPLHVFHIHTNAYQVVSNAGTTYAKPIWMDSITLPPKGQTVMMRSRFEDYTGQYVLHCHFLGHEDRGMMLSVQTVCPNDPSTYGTPDPRGGADRCTVPIAKALSPCAPAERTVMKKK